MSSSVAEAVTKERLHSSGEDYLKAIFILEAQHGSVRSVEVAEYMNVSCLLYTSPSPRDTR